MKDFFHSLTPAEHERLSMLIEEASEIVHIGCKILRHGYESYHPDDEEKVKNRVHLERELRELVAVAKQMDKEGDILFSSNVAPGVWQKKLRYTHHQTIKGDR